MIYYIFFLEFINLSYSFVPLWSFQKSSLDIYRENIYYKFHYYQITEKVIYDYIKLEGYITYFDNILNRYSQLTINNKNFGNTKFNDIESAYYINDGYYIVCPKGKFHAYEFYDYQSFKELIPENFQKKDDWELKCYMHKEENYIFIAYLNSKNDFYQFDFKMRNWKYRDNKIGTIIYDFKWNTTKDSDYYDKKQMFAILNKKNEFILSELYFDVFEGQNYAVSERKKRVLTNFKTNSSAFFIENNETHNFYWINYNNASDFESGYYNKNILITSDNFFRIETIKNVKSPLEFYDKVTIKEMKFIPYTKYVYYEIENDDKKTTYHGIIDIEQNKVIFNTDEKINQFFPATNNSMFAVADETIYKICFMRNDNNECVDECPEGQIPIYDTLNGNKCGTKCSTQFILWPQNICINSCDLDIYTQNGDQCGYCKDIDKEGKKFKLVKHEGCLEKRPDNSYFINEDLYLIACKEGVEFKDGKCGDDKEEKKCYDNCQDCSGKSDDPNAQKCTSCKENFVLFGENCIINCPDKYFQNNDNRCEDCSASCKLCNIKADNCTACNDGLYLDSNNKCQSCYEKCKTCLKEGEENQHNCLSCYQENNFTYFFNNSCLEECPENTTKTKNNECIPYNNDEDNNNDNENDYKGYSMDKKDLVFSVIFIIITGLFLLIIIFCFCKNVCSTNKNEKLINQIYTELV